MGIFLIVPVIAVAALMMWWIHSAINRWTAQTVSEIEAEFQAEEAKYQLFVHSMVDKSYWRDHPNFLTVAKRQDIQRHVPSNWFVS